MSSVSSTLKGPESTGCSLHRGCLTLLDDPCCHLACLFLPHYGLFLRGTAGLLTVFKTRPHWGFTLHSSDSGLVWFFLFLGMELLFPQHCCPRTPFLDSHKWLRAQHCIFKVRILLFFFFLWCHHFMVLKFICHSYLQLNFILRSMSEFLYVKGRERRRAVQQCWPSQCLQMSLAIAWWSCIHSSLINPFHCLTSNTDKCTTFKARFFFFLKKTTYQWLFEILEQEINN